MEQWFAEKEVPRRAAIRLIFGSREFWLDHVMRRGYPRHILSESYLWTSVCNQCLTTSHFLFVFI